MKNGVYKCVNENKTKSYNMKNGVYKCVNGNKTTVYVGSSGVTLEKLEWNHRNYDKFTDGYPSNFRKKLREQGEKWVFEWIIDPYECTKKEIENYETYCINYLKPLFNVDKNPVKSSIRYGRYV